MKRAPVPPLLLALSIFVTPLVHAQGMGGMEMKGDMKGIDTKSEKKAKSQTHKGSGTVSKVDAEKSSVTIAHGPIESMKWPAMSMTFKLKDKKMLDNVKQGDKVDFEFVNRGKDHVITALK
ncbi:MAG TPA: copper-binding protein [Burkholderiales bacterium]|nr:copper-binding protein [Burkholderiales bacterium]